MKLRNHADPSWMLRKALLLVVLTSYYCYASSLVYDCNVGCDLDISVNGDVVCGSDNNVYPNECFAVCQVCCSKSQYAFENTYSIFFPYV